MTEKLQTAYQQHLEEKSRLELARIVGRLIKLGRTSEEIKVWFVENIPEAMRSAALRRR